MPTQGVWDQQGSQPDLQIFIGADEFTDILAASTLQLSGEGFVPPLYANVPETATSLFVKSLSELLLRSGVYATPLWSGFTGTLGTGTPNSGATQEAFGTAAAVAGPTKVPNTRGPLATQPGVPPQPASTLDTLTGGVNGPQPKGIQIDSVDVIYQVLALAAAAADIGLTKTVFANLVAPVTTNLIAYGANGLPTAIGAEPQVTNVPVIAPASMIVASDTDVVLGINLAAGATGSIQFYGAVIKAHYNLN